MEKCYISLFSILKCKKEIKERIDRGRRGSAVTVPPSLQPNRRAEVVVSVKLGLVEEEKVSVDLSLLFKFKLCLTRIKK